MSTLRVQRREYSLYLFAIACVFDSISAIYLQFGDAAPSVLFISLMIESTRFVVAISNITYQHRQQQQSRQQQLSVY